MQDRTTHSHTLSVAVTMKLGIKIMYNVIHIYTNIPYMHLKSVLLKVQETPNVPFTSLSRLSSCPSSCLSSYPLVFLSIDPPSHEDAPGGRRKALQTRVMDNQQQLHRSNDVDQSKKTIQNKTKQNNSFHMFQDDPSLSIFIFKSVQGRYCLG